MLFDTAVNIAKQRKAEYIWLGVWEFNHKAMRFYMKNGFVRFGEHKFIFGDEEVEEKETELFKTSDIQNKN